MISFNEFLGKISIGAGVMVQADSIGQQGVSTLGYTGRPNNLSDTLLMLNNGEFAIPTTKIVGFITKVIEKQDPIIIFINKKTKIYQTRTQYNNIRNKIKLGTGKVEVIFQKRPSDDSLEISQVQSINFLD
jgi:hypothetical protein